MEEILAFIDENIDGRTLFTKELTYELEGGALQGVYSDQMSFSNLKHSRSGFQLDMLIVSNDVRLENGILRLTDPTTRREFRHLPSVRVGGEIDCEPCVKPGCVLVRQRRGLDCRRKRRLRLHHRQR